MPSNDRESLDNRIAIARSNIAHQTQQAAMAKGDAAEERVANRIRGQQALLDELQKEREALGVGTSYGNYLATARDSEN
jgi:hypothetical protein